MDFYTQIIINGFQTAALYALIAVGLTLVFGVMRIVNFAHAEFYMIGAYATLAAVERGAPYLLGVAAAGLVVGTLGVIIDQAVFRRLRNNELMGLVASLGLVLVLQVAVQQLFGTYPRGISMAFPQRLSIFGAVVVLHRVFIIVAAVVLLSVLGLFLKRTKSGLAIIASAEDADAAALQGINRNSAARVTMGIGAALAGLAGGILAPTTVISPQMGMTIILPAFVVVIVGGAGSVRGALIASILFGMIQSASTTLISPTAAVATGLVAMLLILSVRPEGLFAA